MYVLINKYIILLNQLSLQIVGVHDYILQSISRDDVRNISHSGNNSFVSHTFSANKNYSAFFEVYTSAGAVNVFNSIFSKMNFNVSMISVRSVQAATYDVQSLSVVGDGDDGVRLRAEFISDSRAAGCLLVLVGPSTSPDIFRALQRPHLEQGTTVRVPPSTYTVYGYDIEEDELPNTMPAVILDRQTITNSKCNRYHPCVCVQCWTCITIHLFTDNIDGDQKQSQILSNASVSLSGSDIVVDCEFVEGNPQSSCVLVYREYNSPLLTVADIPQLFNFPVSITVSDPENYTFALFGKDSELGMEEESVVCVKFILHELGES